MNLETEGEECRLKLFATSAQQGLRIVVRQAGVIRFEESVASRLNKYSTG